MLAVAHISVTASIELAIAKAEGVWFCIIQVLDLRLQGLNRAAVARQLLFILVRVPWLYVLAKVVVNIDSVCHAEYRYSNGGLGVYAQVNVIEVSGD